MELSERLYSITEMVTPGHVVADVGCDHGYVSIYLVEEGIIPRAIAMDVGVGPLERAKQHIEEAGLTDYIETRLSDGVRELQPGEAECLIIAGMGGPLMQRIMEEGRKVLSEMKEFILQPQSEIAEFRHFLQDNGYHIISESMVCEEGKYYPMMKAIHGEMHYENEVDFRYGRILLHEENPILHQFLRKEEQHYVNLLEGLNQSEQTDRVEERRQELEQELTYTREALGYYQYGADGFDEDYKLM